MAKRGRNGLVVVLAVVAAGCAAALVHPSPEDVRRASVRWPDVTLETLQRGRALYVRKCGGCHQLHLPEESPPDEWPKVIELMVETQGVDLRAEDREAISRYLVTMSARAHESSSTSSLKGP